MREILPTLPHERLIMPGSGEETELKFKLGSEFHIHDLLIQF